MADAVVTLPERPAKGDGTSLVDVRTCTIRALTRLYEAIIQLCSIPPEALMIPPDSGFEGVAEDELRQRGKNEAVIDLLRHLPYLDQRNQNNNWTVAEGTLHINYAQGDLYHKWFEDDIVPVPGHTIWLSSNNDKYGSDWLLDTKTWSLIEVTLMGSSQEWDHETYERTPKEDRWQSYSRMPAASFFDLLRYKYETLEFLLVRDPKAFDGTARTYEKDPQMLWEESLFNSDDEETDADFEHEASTESDSSSTDEEDEDWEMLEDVKEVEWLRNDVEERPFPGFTESDARLEAEAEKDPLQGCSRCSLFCNGRSREIKKPDASIWNKPHDIKRRQLIRELQSIYHKNGWPRKPLSRTVSSYRVFRHPGDELELTSYNRQACADDLRKWMTSVLLREHEEMENHRREESEQSSKELMVFRHKLQKLLLTRDAKPGKPELEKASGVLDELQYFEKPIEWKQITTCRLDKVLKASLASDLPKKDDDCGVAEQIRVILDSWKILEEASKQESGNAV